MTDQHQTESNSEIHEEVAPKWFIDEGIPGSGERPAWLNEKFKTAAELAKSHSELEKRLGSVPDNYDVSKSKFIDPEYASFQDFFQFAKEKRVPQEVIDKMVGSIDSYMDEFSLDPAKEAAKLGEHGGKRIEVLNNWAKANLSDESYTALTGSVRSAEGIKALEELRSKMMSGATIVPNGNDSGSSQSASLSDIQAEISTNLEKYKTDPAYRRDLQNRLEVAAKNSGYVDKVGS